MYQPGDEVRHKGGGPDMVVESYTAKGEVVYSYWHKRNRIRGTFVEATLEGVPPPQPPSWSNPKPRGF
jgi:uncharacterized protein YodC (DUF2158 family)